MKGENIPLTGRIVALADVFDALTTKRCYKPAFSLEESMKIIKEGTGRHFDPQVVQAFNNSIDRPAIALCGWSAIVRKFASTYGISSSSSRCSNALKLKTRPPGPPGPRAPGAPGAAAGALGPALGGAAGGGPEGAAPPSTIAGARPGPPPGPPMPPPFAITIIKDFALPSAIRLSMIRPACPWLPQPVSSSPAPCWRYSTG